jgi:hypothetical protein
MGERTKRATYLSVADVARQLAAERATADGAVAIESVTIPVRLTVLRDGAPTEVDALLKMPGTAFSEWFSGVRGAVIEEADDGRA